MNLETFTEIVAWLGFPFGCFALGMSAITFAYFLTNRHKHNIHIALMAASYCKLTVLMVATINYRIFYDGIPRFVGAIVLVTAFIEGTIGLLLIFRRKAKDLRHRTEG